MKKEIEAKIKQLDQAIKPIWEHKGLTVEEYSQNLEKKLLNTLEMIKSKTASIEMIQSAINETIEFVAWGSSYSDIIKASSLLKSILREDTRRGKTKRNNKRREL